MILQKISWNNRTAQGETAWNGNTVFKSWLSFLSRSPSNWNSTSQCGSNAEMFAFCLWELLHPEWISEARKSQKKNGDVWASGHQSQKGSLWSLRVMMKSKWFLFPQSCLSSPLVSEASLLFHSKTQCSTGAKGRRQRMPLTLQPAPVFFTPCHKAYCAGASRST